MAKYYKTVAPEVYLNTFLDEAVRPDGRGLNEWRHLRIQKGYLDHVEASCLVTLGSTIVTCAIVVEATDTKPGDTLQDYIDLHTDLPHMSRQHLKSFQHIHLSTSLSSALLSILNNSESLTPKDFYEEECKCYRRLRCELVVMNDDGCIMDALTLSLSCALIQLKLPKVSREERSGGLVVERNRGVERSKAVVAKETFVTLSFAVLRDGRVLVDPTECEEGVVSARVVMVASLTRDHAFPLHTRAAVLPVVEQCRRLCKERLEVIRNIIGISL